MVPLADGGHPIGQAGLCAPDSAGRQNCWRVIPECAILPPDFARLSHLCVCWHAGPVSVDAEGSHVIITSDVND